MLIQGCNSESENTAADTTNATQTSTRGATGPQGTPGLPGTNGTNGTNGAPGAVQLVGVPQTLDYQIDETYLNSTTKILFVSGAVQLLCPTYFASVNLMTKESSTAAWVLEHHFFKDSSISNIRFPVSFLLKPGASFKVMVANNNDNLHCPTGLANFPDVMEWKTRALN